MIIIPIICGLLSGIISGMGIGGGTILIPALSIFLHLSQHAAQGINLLYFIPTAIVALIVHIKNKNVDFKSALSIIIYGIGGAVIGAYIANITDAGLLRKIFAVFLLLMGIYEIFKKNKQNSKK